MMETTEKIDIFEFDIDAASISSSGEAFTARPVRPETGKVGPELETGESVSAIFKLLSRPVLPELRHETRARLMMQSPTRLYLYWSIGGQSFHALQRVVGGAASHYRLALRLLDLRKETEELHAAEPDGSWWFDVRPDTEYRAEIGFYSVSRPFVRILFSNTIRTPRKSPSPHSAAEARWAVTTHKFAELLDASGFEEDAFEVLDGERDSQIASRFARYVGIKETAVNAFNNAEIKRALALLAAGSPIEDLKYKIAAELYALLEQHLGKLPAGSICEELGVTDADLVEYETFSVFGGSLVNIPRRRFRPVSSSDLG